MYALLVIIIFFYINMYFLYFLTVLGVQYLLVAGTLTVATSLGPSEPGNGN